MDINKCKVLTTVEFGSTYQNTADKYSDVDLFHLVMQPTTDVVFRNHEKASHHSEDGRYHSIERFISLMLKGSFDNVLLLCAQLEQAGDSSFNEEVLDELYNPEVFNTYIRASLRPLAMSLIGQMNLFARANGSDSEDRGLSGKDMIRYITFCEHLYYCKKLLEDHELIPEIDRLVKLSDSERQLWIELKRLTPDELGELADNTVDLKAHEGLVQEVKGLLNENNSMIQSYNREMHKVADRLKENVVRYQMKYGDVS